MSYTYFSGSYNLFATRAIYQQKKHRSEEEQQSRGNSDKKERVITIRPLNMEDFREAKNQVVAKCIYALVCSQMISFLATRLLRRWCVLQQVAASFAAEGSIMAELKQWNEAYGEGGSRKKEQLSYFL